MVVIFFKQKTAYEMRISDWSSDVCSSDLIGMPCRSRVSCGPPHFVVAGYYDQRRILLDRPPRPDSLPGADINPDDRGRNTPIAPSTTATIALLTTLYRPPPAAEHRYPTKRVRVRLT